jgi:lipoprotein-anchoring transpeptidase ErfK/SrfK
MRQLIHRRQILAAGAAASGTLWLPRAAAGQSANPLAAETVYFEDTGHTVSGAFLRFWRQYGLEAFGFPISEAFDDGGVRNQYFQRARFELAPDGSVQLGLLGIEAGGATPAPAAEVPLPEGALVVAETGHSVAGAFLSAYRAWRATLGSPIGPEQQVGPGEAYVQYFSHGRLEYDAASGLRRGLVGEEIAKQRGVLMSPVPLPAGAATWREYLGALAVDEADRRAFAARVTNNAPFVPGFGQKWVLVNLTQQRAYAYEHVRQVFTDTISSGRSDKGLSTRGVFAINRRIANEVMDSTTIGYPKGHPKYYRLENVLWTQYYNGAEALHYAWWHSNFGQPMSYGCINMRLNTAKYFWDWAPMGTPVIVV